MRTHYDRVQNGQWTYESQATHGPIIFRKGSPADENFVGKRVLDLTAEGCAVATSEWGIVDETALEAILDAANEKEWCEDRM